MEGLQQKLDEWYAADPSRRTIFERTVKGQLPGVSLRKLDWTVTNYSRRHTVSYPHPETKEPYPLYMDYKDTLKVYHKPLFDAFRRKAKAGSTDKAATLCQKNFIKWAIENGVIEYVRNNGQAIEQDMMSFKKKKKELTYFPALSPSPVSSQGEVI